MKEFAEQKSFNFPYLFDRTQQVARDFGARRTPEFFVLDADRRVAYMGALDDSPDGTNVSKRYLEQAIDAVLAGQQPSVAETIAIGCNIRFVRSRRRKR